MKINLSTIAYDAMLFVAIPSTVFNHEYQPEMNEGIPPPLCLLKQNFS